MSYTLLFKTNKLFSVISKSKASLMAFNTEAEKIDYSPDTLLEEGQCFQITDFKGKDYCPEFLNSEFATGHYSQWEPHDQDIEFSLNTDGQDFYFQKFVKSQLLQKNWFSISADPILKDEKIITLNPNANAFYNKKEKILLFKKLEDLKKIFPNIETLYREATQEEVKTFFDNDLFDISKKYKTKNLGILNRKRIALTGNKLNQVQDKKYFFDQLRTYCNDIEIRDNEKIVIKTETDLRNILYALDERFYTTELSSEKRLANSIVKIPTS